MQCGAVWVTRGSNTQRLRRAKRQLRLGDKLHLYYDVSVLTEQPSAPQLIADLGEYSVWDKPRGLRSQGSKWGDHCTLYRWAEQHLVPQRSAFIVHRLDRAASGLMLTAHSKSMASQLSALFRERKIHKTYRATVHGDLSDAKSPRRIDAPLDDKEAVTFVSFLERRNAGSASAVDVRIETGRKHQIRRHLADLGHPIIGDRLYGSGSEDGIDLQLRAIRLEFICPIRSVPVDYFLETS